MHGFFPISLTNHRFQIVDKSCFRGIEDWNYKTTESTETASYIYNKALSLGERRNWVFRHDTSETWVLKKRNQVILSSFGVHWCYVYSTLFRKLHIRVNVTFTPVFNVGGFFIRSIVFTSRNLTLHWLYAFILDVSFHMPAFGPLNQVSVSNQFDRGQILVSNWSEDDVNCWKLRKFSVFLHSLVG